ncbi:MAG TPA: hypothetical protein VJW76_04025, partial [Verrucomicrobiae bacterium]|nr:hypothetical protein [Verrucomicrobiae bacterium]
GILVFPLIVLCIRENLSRRDVLRMMSENVPNNPPPFATVTEALAAVNRCCRTYTFNVEHAANILFRGRQVTLIVGNVGRIGGDCKLGPTMFFDTSLYALADDQQVEWMKANSDVFSAAYLGSPYSVFWVKLTALKANRAAPANRSQPLLQDED